MSFLSVLLAHMPGFDELISRHWLPAKLATMHIFGISTVSLTGKHREWYLLNTLFALVSPPLYISVP